MENSQQKAAMKKTEVVVAKCECCGLTEECTEAYMKRVRDRNSGRWICGLCTEAVKDEMVRSGRGIGAEEAMNRHMSFCKNFKTQKPTDELISAVKHLLLKSLDSPRKGNKPGLLRSHSCQPVLRSGRFNSDN